MADIRVNLDLKRSRQPGTTVGVRVNTFGLQRLMAGIDGNFLAEAGVDAMQIAHQDAYANWAVLTGASRDSLIVVVTEVGDRHARVELQAGGDRLKADPRNPKGKDYAPYLEFNGSPSGSQPAGVLLQAVNMNDREIRQRLHDLTAQRIKELIP